MYWLGTITGASGSYNNLATGLSGIGAFAIPPSVRSLYLMPSASGLAFELSSATGISFQTTAARSAQLAGPNVISGPFRVQGENVVVAIWNAAGGFVSCRVYAGARP